MNPFPTIPMPVGLKLRRAAFGLLALGAVCALAQPGGASRSTESAPMPAVNFVIEVRQTEETEASSGVTYGTRRDSGQQQVMVMNGGRAVLRFGQTQLWQWYQVAPDGRGGMAVQPSNLLVEGGRGVVVQPRWPGGAQPVTLELAAESTRLPGQSAPNPTAVVREGTTAGTTLLVPLGQWITVARTADASQRQGGRTWGAGESSRQMQYALQVRITTMP